MFVPAPIDNDFVPYTKRSMMLRNAGLFVDGAATKGRGGSRVVPQQQNPCVGKHNIPCGDACPFPDMNCCNGQPKFGPC
jgi:hypothetical protein